MPDSCPDPGISVKPGLDAAPRPGKDRDRGEVSAGRISTNCPEITVRHEAGADRPVIGAGKSPEFSPQVYRRGWLRQPSGEQDLKKDQRYLTGGSCRVIISPCF